MSEVVLENVMNSLDLMWKGMLGLFVVAGIIALLTGIVAKCFKRKGN